MEVMIDNLTPQMALEMLLACVIAGDAIDSVRELMNDWAYDYKVEELPMVFDLLDAREEQYARKVEILLAYLFTKTDNK